MNPQKKIFTNLLYNPLFIASLFPSLARTRKKVKLAFIAHNASRKSTYKKRKKGLLKKISELSTLCGIEACAIIYGPNETQPEVWPNVPGVHRVISKFKMMPEMEQSKKMMNQESFIGQRIVKAIEQLKRQRENNRGKEMKEVMYQCLTGAGVEKLGMGELNHLGKVLDQSLSEISMTIDKLAIREGLNNKEIMHVGEQKPSLEFCVEAMNKLQWFNEWVNHQNEQMGFGGYGHEKMLPFRVNNGNNVTSSSSFFH